MALYPARIVERAMKIPEVILRAAGGKILILWMQAAEILIRDIGPGHATLETTLRGAWL